MSEILKDLEQEQAKHRRQVEAVAVPKGWEPYAEFTDQIGEAIVRLPTPGASERDLLISSGFDPTEWKIDGPVQTRKWMRYDQEWNYYYRFQVISGESEEIVQEHIDDLIARIQSSDPLPVREVSSNDAYVVALADWQIGKSFNGNGTDQAVTRIKKALDESYEYFLTTPTEHVILAGLGDLVENCDGHYASQSFIVDRNVRDQNKIARELIYYAIDKFYSAAGKLTIICCGGNHGENRKDGKAYTDQADNLDVAVFESVKEAYDRAGVSDIEWIIPQHELSLSLDVGNITLGITHGHLFRTGATAQQKAKNWWAGQVFGYQPVENAQILLSGHFHHASVTTFGKRTHIQTSAMDCGSAWFSNSSGEDSPPGLLTFRITEDNTYGWDDLKIFWSET